MFKIKTYKYHTHLAIIAGLIALLCIIFLSSFVLHNNTPNDLVNNPSNPYNEQEVVLDGIVGNYHVSLPEEIQAADDMDNLRTIKRGNTITIFFDNANNQPVNTKDNSDYSIKCEKNFIVIYDKDRVVGTLTYGTTLGRLLVRDNE